MTIVPTIIKNAELNQLSDLCKNTPYLEPFFWHHYLIQEFPPADGYDMVRGIVQELPEVLVVRVVHKSYRVVLLWVKFDGEACGYLNHKLVEQKTLLAAQKTMNKETKTTYIMTSHNMSCRFWKLDEDAQGMTPFDGTDVEGDASQYAPAKGQEVHRIETAIIRIRLELLNSVHESDSDTEGQNTPDASDEE